MKVLFLRNVLNVADSGDIKDVAAGYARNYLFPQKLAAPATPELIRQREDQRESVARRMAQQETQLRALAKELEGISVVIKAKSGGKGRLYGSITNSDIAISIQQSTGHNIDRRLIEIIEPIRTVGAHKAILRLARNINPAIHVVIEEEEAK